MGFGSTRDPRPVGSLVFVNCAFPTLGRDAVEPSPVTLGPDCPNPYTTRSFYNTSAMSYGSISRPAVQALSQGAAMAGIWLNTGEGGLAPYHLEGGCDLVFQIGTAKYGVRAPDGKLDEALLRRVAEHEQVRMFEIKLSQGAKPGKGGVLPARKVGPEIARIRNIPEGKESISPNRHEEIDSVSDLLDFVARVRDITGKPVGFKTVIGAYGWIEDLCREIHRRGISSAPDFITVDSADGGSGAAPQVLMDYVGLRINESLPMVVDLLTAWDLHERIRIVASGKLIGPAQIAWALAVGADFVNSARGFMFALGCIQAMRCHKNTCPTGVTTHNPRLQRALDPEEKSARVANYALNVMHEVEMIAHSCGVPEPRRLRRYHARMITEDGRSRPIDDLYPYAVPGEALRAWQERAIAPAQRKKAAGDTGGLC